ncbi:Transmembrane protein [Ceratobasidium theobromae]|uniref:Transmembrane protein n=1 Tax=Ceratobasidium theobromae TaxID=1582974 RepID=A0A5N5QAX1_9AGAM|nr:Transmembrane protein [Ceratobasidium theobromae]
MSGVPEPPQKDVKLSTLKFANWRKAPNAPPPPPPPPSRVDDDTTPPPNPPVPLPAPPVVVVPPDEPPLDARPRETVELMAEDKPGEELAGDATVWKLYLEEAAEHDEELVKGRYESLDVLLLFASLFSVILAVFLVESKKMLHQDPADASVALLTLMIQSQQRMELGLAPQPSAVAPFVPTATARWINGIWFAALCLSLSAALVAMLGKEWLTAYQATRPRPPHSHALVRQSRLEGLERWWALHIIALLPSLLHVSLYLFSIGLVLYLSTLDTIVAGAIALMVGGATMFYVITTVQGAIYEYCPFATQISRYLRSLGDTYLARPGKDSDSHSSPSLKDIQALLWLANNARDPAVIDCSFQALAGLHLPTETPKPAATESKSVAVQESDVMPMQLDQQTTLASLFDTVCKRVEKLMQDPLELSTQSGVNMIARYTMAISKLAVCLEKHYTGQSLSEKGLEPQVNGFKHVAIKTNHLPDTYVTRPLNIIEHLWSPESPAFISDAYARFLVSELTLLQVAARSGVNVESKQEMRKTDRNDGSTAPNFAKGTVETTSKPDSNSQVLTLQTRYRQAIARATALLWVHSKHDAPMSFPTLKMLLDSLSASAKCEALNRDAPIYTQQPHAQIVIPLLNVAECRFNALDLNSGPLGGLISLLAMGSESQTESSLQMRRCIIQCMSHVAPAVLEQVLSMEVGSLFSEFDLDTWPEAHHLSDLHGVGYASTRQMLTMLRYLGPQLATNDKLEVFCVEAMRVINLTLLEDKEDKGGRFSLWAHGEELIPILEFVGGSESNLQLLSRHSIFYLIDMTRLRPIGLDASLIETKLPPNTLPPLLRMIGLSDTTDKATEELVEAVVRRMRPRDDWYPQHNIIWNHIPSLDYLHTFTHTDQGFSAFVHVARQERYSHLAIDAIVKTARLAAGRDPELEVEDIELGRAAVPGFLDAVSIIAKHCSGDMSRRKLLLDFAQDAVDLVRVALTDPGSLPLVAAHPASHDLASSIWAVGDIQDAQKVLDQLDKLRNRSKRRAQGASVSSMSSNGSGAPISDKGESMASSIASVASNGVIIFP